MRQFVYALVYSPHQQMSPGDVLNQSSFFLVNLLQLYYLGSLVLAKTLLLVMPSDTQHIVHPELHGTGQVTTFEAIDL